MAAPDRRPIIGLVTFFEWYGGLIRRDWRSNSQGRFFGWILSAILVPVAVIAIIYGYVRAVLEGESTASGAVKTAVALVAVVGLGLALRALFVGLDGLQDRAFALHFRTAPIRNHSEAYAEGWKSVDREGIARSRISVRIWNEEIKQWQSGYLDAALMRSKPPLRRVRENVAVSLLHDNEYLIKTTARHWITPSGDIDNIPIYEFYAEQWDVETLALDDLCRVWIASTDSRALQPIVSRQRPANARQGPDSERALAKTPRRPKPTTWPSQ